MDSTDLLIYLIIFGVILIFGYIYYNYNCLIIKQSKEDKYMKILKDIIKNFNYIKI
jgi:hypothetical protein